MTSLTEEPFSEDDLVEDEIWENQRREGGMWLPAWDRGRFSDRFGRHKYNQVFDVPVPPATRVVEDFAVSTVWAYAKNFATLESDLAKGFLRTERWNHSVRWRKWTRKRYSAKETVSSEMMAGWLGSRERRGTWKSRYFYLIQDGGASGTGLQSTTQSSTGMMGQQSLLGNGGGVGGEDSEDDSSNDEGDVEDVDEDFVNSGSAPISNSQPRHMPAALFPQREAETEDLAASSPLPTVARQVSEPSTSSHHDVSFASSSSLSASAPLLIYLRRSFADPRAVLFPLAFDAAEIRAFPKRQVRRVKLSGRVKIDDSLATSEFPGRFAIRFSISGRKRVLNAPNAEARERWVEALRTMIEESAGAGGDVTMSPSSSKKQGRLAAAFQAAKRGQKELRKGFGTLRRSSHHQLVVSASSPSQQLQMPSPVLSPMLPPVVANANAHMPRSASLTTGGSEQQPHPLLLTSPSRIVELLRAEPSGAINVRFAEPAAGKGLFVEAVLENARDASTGATPTELAIGDQIVAVQGESLLGLDKGMALAKLKEVLASRGKTDRIALTVIPVSSPKAAASSSTFTTKKSGSPTAAKSETMASSVPAPIAKREHHSPPGIHAAKASSFALENPDDSEDDYSRKPSSAGGVINKAASSPTLTGSSSPASWMFKLPTNAGPPPLLSSTSSQTAMNSSSSSIGSGIPPLARPPARSAASTTVPVKPATTTTAVRQKVVEVPPNTFGIVSSHARSTTLKCLERMTSGGSPVTYGQLRQEVAKALHVSPAETAFETDEWRLWFRDFLDYWVCDGTRYKVGGLDFTDFTPVIIRINSSSGGTAIAAADTASSEQRVD